LTEGCKAHSTPTATTPVPPAYTTTEGILVAGGYYGNNADGRTSVEVFVPGNKKFCRLPNLPYPRASFTVDIVENTVVVCGGTFDINDEKYKHTLKSCLQLTLSGWVRQYATLKTKRFGHTSWKTEQGLMLLGGYYGDTTELVKPGADPIILANEAWRACAITDTDSIIITGSYQDIDKNDNHYYGSRKVVRYNLQGHVENLPEMNQGRWGHGCGAYTTSNSTVLIVAGGDSGNSIKDHLHSSTEKLVVGASSWTRAGSLPRTLSWVASVSMDNTVFITGGQADITQAEVLAFDVVGEIWRKVGRLQDARSAHAATKVDMETVKPFCDI